MYYILAAAQTNTPKTSPTRRVLCGDGVVGRKFVLRVLRFRVLAETTMASAQQDAIAGPTAVMAGPALPALQHWRAPALEQSSDAAVAVPQAHPLMARFTGVAMKVPYAVIVGGNGRDWDSDWSYMARDYDTVGSLIHMTFARCDAIVNEWNDGSVVTTALNAAAAPSEIELPAELAEVLRTCEQVHAISGGRFDPTVGALCSAWRAALCSSAREPAPLSAAEVARLMECVGWGRVFRVDDAGERASKQVEGAALALGGVAKGWCVRLQPPTRQAASLCVGGCIPMCQAAAVGVGGYGPLHASGASTRWLRCCRGRASETC